ncbi:hypothetical protein A9B99_14585 [Mangrovibacter phragmitis]|jgi:uncharacterized membrane protein YhaH (DUF805 family)|uniref:DUF805 domain-containing protein n=1 Tax=Mangrovibacter phragmitis TaxID=1691903 RepID=A0A1B7L013_9ENTR|nr:DUF805 domain-containing protein [Mangrovibacter phragmitis]OAT75535.1 hypothetical protein A9B99_14585 [Mangrovibacter phragmitis]
MDWYLSALRNYFGFQGRARRKEFWMFTLVNIIFAAVLAVLDNMLHLRIHEQGVLSSLYSLFVLIPSLALQFRRLHDTNRSAWWLLLMFIPLIGALILLAFYCQEGNRGANRFGNDPKIAIN